MPDAASSETCSPDANGVGENGDPTLIAPTPLASGLKH